MLKNSHDEYNCFIVIFIKNIFFFGCFLDFKVIKPHRDV